MLLVHVFIENQVDTHHSLSALCVCVYSLKNKGVASLLSTGELDLYTVFNHTQGMGDE